MEPTWSYRTALVTSEPVPPWRKATLMYSAKRRTRVEWGTPDCTTTRVVSVRVGIVYENQPSVFPWRNAEPGEWIEVVLVNESDETRPLSISLDLAELDGPEG